MKSVVDTALAQHDIRTLMRATIYFAERLDKDETFSGGKHPELRKKLAQALCQHAKNAYFALNILFGDSDFRMAYLIVLSKDCVEANRETELQDPRFLHELRKISTGA